MVGHIPFDHKHRRWMRERDLTYPVFPIGAEKYYPVQESGTVLGTISSSMAEDSGVKEGLPVYAAGSDKACELLGLGCCEESRAAIGLGTTATISYMSDTYQEPERFIPAYAGVIPGKWNPEIEIFRGYWLIAWFKKESQPGADSGGLRWTDHAAVLHSECHDADRERRNHRLQ